MKKTIPNENTKKKGFLFVGLVKKAVTYVQHDSVNSSLLLDFIIIDNVDLEKKHHLHRPSKNNNNKKKDGSN